MFSCLHLTSACIQVVRSSTSENGNSRLLCFDWLFQTFWHWRVLLSRWTEPENAILIRFFLMKWAARPGHSSGPMEGYMYIYYNPFFFLYITQRASPHFTAAHWKNSRCSRWPVRHCLDVTLTYYLATTSSCSSLHASLSSVEPKIRYFKDCC